VADLDASSPADAPATRDDVVLIRDTYGALSLELMPVRESIARGFLRFSPRNLRPSQAAVRVLSEQLSGRPYHTILVQDSRKRLLRKALAQAGWRIEVAIPGKMTRQCSIVTTYELPLDENLMDSNGDKPDVTRTSDMHGIRVDIEGRKAWAFYTDDGENARVVSEGERRQGMLVATNNDDMAEVADCLVRFLAFTGRPWAVFSMDMGRFVRQFNPITMLRMVNDHPRPFDHRGGPASSSNKRALTRLFSEYYDESLLEAMLRLRRYRADRSLAVYHIDGGFVITKRESDAGLIFDIYVTPARQGEGIGAELMRCGLTSLVGRVSSVYLHTSYPRAKRLYEKFGFKTVYSQLGIRLDETALYPPRAV
jgi:ribosomal protein S18 acetylase RimI-like enzyme